MASAVLKSKPVPVLSAPPAPSSEPPKAVVKRKRRRKLRPEEVAAVDRTRFRRLYEETVERYGETLKQLSRIR